MKINIIITTILVICLACSCSDKPRGDPNKILLEKILTNLNQIETANYVSTCSAYNVYDTIVPVYVSDHYFKEYKNPLDTFIGASYVRLNISDTTKMEFSYDGYMRSQVDWQEGFLQVDSFKTYRFPFRQVLAPFFNRATAILKYMTDTNDSISIVVKNFGDSLQINLTVYDTINAVDFHLGNQSIYSPQVKEMYETDFSRYSIWVKTANYLPYKIKRDLPHNISIESNRRVRINSDNISNFSAKSYFPDLPSPEKNKPVKSNLLGTKAPIWILKDTENRTVSLNDLKGKVVLIEFTGIGCGPCHAAIPFLKELASKYDDTAFEVVGIETWNQNIDMIKRYHEKQGMNYKTLQSNKLIEKLYQVDGVPRFYLLNRNHEIVEVFQGYSKSVTDPKIKTLIEEMI
jgi:thiol-disulfide isomerase/thioredoxin